CQHGSGAIEFHLAGCSQVADLGPEEPGGGFLWSRRQVFVGREEAAGYVPFGLQSRDSDSRASGPLLERRVLAFFIIPSSVRVVIRLFRLRFCSSRGLNPTMPYR